MKTKQKNRNTKKFKKSINKKNHKPNKSTYSIQIRRFLKLFGNPQIEKLMLLNEYNLSEDTLTRFKEGEIEFHKIIHSLNKKEVLNELFKLHTSNPNTYKKIVEIFIFLPYQKFGNRKKTWFPNFYENISKFQQIRETNEQKIIPLYRAMTKSEFITSLSDGVQTPSWTSELKNIPTFIYNNLLTMNDNVVLIKSFFNENDICFIPSDFTNTEKEVWVRKGSKPVRTFCVGEYNKSHYLSMFDLNKIDNETLNKLTEDRILTNGFCTEECQSIINEITTQNSNDIIFKLSNFDLPKLNRKISKDKKLNSISKLLENVYTSLNKSIEYYETISSTLNPVNV